MEFLPELSRKVSESIASPVTDASVEVITIPEQFAVYKKIYVDSAISKQKINKFISSNTSLNINEQVEPVPQVITHQTVFLFDITGSMQSVIDSVKKEIVPVMQRLKDAAIQAVSETAGDNNRFVLNFEIAVVGYRDFTDSTHFNTHDFTSEIPEIEEFLKSLNAEGGGDEPEDVKGAFIHALFGISDKAKKLQWKTDTASKSIYMITDAPAHGASFHSLSVAGDYYLHDSEDEWKTILEEMKSNEIMFNIIKINGKTTKMCDKFRSMCEIAEMSYIEIDIQQQISHSYSSHGSLERMSIDIGCPPMLTGDVETSMTSMYRMTSAGYATRTTSHTPVTSSATTIIFEHS